MQFPTFTPPPNLADKLYGIVPRPVPGYIFEPGEGVTKVLTNSGEKIASLSPTAAIILELCDGVRRIQDISEILIESFTGESEMVNGDVLRTLSHLRHLQLIGLSGCPDPESSGSPEYLGQTYHCNRGTLVPEILEERGWRRAQDDEIAHLSVWSPLRAGLRIAKHQPFEVHRTTELRSKKRLWENLVRAGSTHVMPETYTNVDEFLEKRRPDGELWFLKLSSSTESRGVYCYRSSHQLTEKAHSFRNQSYVIQRGIDDVHQIDGRKSKFRVYVLVTGGGVYVHEDARTVIQRAPYDTIEYRSSRTNRSSRLDHQVLE